MVEWIQKYWLTVVFGSATGLLTLIIKKAYSAIVKKYEKLITSIENEKNEQFLMKEGLLSLLHDKLYQACQYHMSMDCITVDDLGNLKSLYKSYCALGGNGTGTELYTRCMGLHISASGVHQAHKQMTSNHD